MTASSTDHSTAAISESCPPCLPFCGLGNGAGITQRLRDCGGALLEQVLAPVPSGIPQPS